MKTFINTLIFLIACCGCNISSGTSDSQELYAESRTYFNRQEYGTALTLALQAYDVAAAHGDEQQMGITARGIASIYTNCHNPKENLRYSKIACRHFHNIGDSVEMAESLLSLAWAYESNGDTTSAIRAREHLLSMDSLYCDTLRRTLALRQKTFLLMDMGKYTAAESIMSNITNSSLSNIQDSAILGQIWIANGRLRDTEQLLSKISHDSSTVSELLRSQYYEKTNQPKMALDALKRFNAVRHSYYSDVAAQNLSGALSEYYEKNKRLKENELRQNLTILCLVIAIAVLLIISLAAWFMLFLHKKNNELEINIQIANELRESFTKKELECGAARKSALTLLREHNRLLDSLCRISYESPYDEVAQRAISRKVSTIIHELSDKPGEFAKLEDLLNNHFDNILENLRRDMPDIKTIDYRLYVFMAVGLSASAVALLLKLDKTRLVYDRKRRLRTRIAALSNSQRYLDLLP